MPGGFAGVDVFFVISGYLMTGIIFSGIENNNFSIVKFYKSRAKRIIPALVFLVLFCYFIGFFILSPIKYLELARHALGSLTFISNFIYWREAGYFDTASHSKWLLHTWSLSVEWQFYIAYPLALTLLKRYFSLSKLKFIVIFAAFFSLLVSIIATMRSADASYYLLPTRAWEMLFGGVAYLYPVSLTNSAKKYTGMVGVFFIAISYVFISKDNLWPGYLAALPVFGAYLILISSQQDGFIAKNKLLQTIGKQSYSIYLWHWPIMVVLNVLEVKYSFEIIGVSLSLLTGAISYKFIESSNKWNLKAAVAAVLCIITIIIYLSNGASFRVDKAYRYSAMEMINFKYGGVGFEPNEFYKVGTGEIKYIFIGDSYGQQYSYGLSESNSGYLSYFDHGCFISKNITRYFNGIEDRQCSSVYEKIRNKIKQYPKASVIIASSWLYKGNHGYKSSAEFSPKLTDAAWEEIISKEIKELINDYGDDRTYYLIGRPQTDPSNAYDCLSKQGMIFAKKCINRTPEVSIKINEFLKGMADENNKLFYFDVNKSLCENELGCLVTDGRYPIYNDGSHISTFGSKLVSASFDKISELSKN